MSCRSTILIDKVSVLTLQMYFFARIKPLTIAFLIQRLTSHALSAISLNDVVDDILSDTILSGLI